MAAAARPPGLGDARVPCPLCGGLVHPVAGRCKHCKEDLSALRAGRPQAAAALPALIGKTGQTGVAPVAYQPAAVPIAVPVGDPRDGSAPILPQRAQSRSMAAQGRRGSLLRNWPMLVIILAMIAIVVAVVIMVMPADNASAGGKRQLMPTPAPDRMDTMPNQQSQADPWGNPNDPGAQAPMPDPNAVPRVTPDPPIAPDPNDPNDLFGQLGGGVNSMFLLSVANQACKKMKSCPDLDNDALDIACGAFAQMPMPPVPTSCPSAQRCLDAIDHIDCDSTSSTQNPLNTVMLIQDCVKAASEC